ncbi:MAG TPA: lipase family protein, partial [Pirellulales bacterium]
TWEVAERLAEMSSAVYSDDDAAREAYRQLGFADSTAIQSGSMVAHVVHGEDVTVVVFRGTDDLEDWRTNLSQLRSSSPNGTVQGGFWLAYNAIKPQVRQHVFATPRKYLWITGHSLGGALALLCAYDLVAHGDSEPTGIMTFGQPMVAGRELASYLDGRFRGRYALFVNETDIVPRMLPAYTHCGSLVWFTGGKIMRSPRRVYSAGPEDFSKASPPTVNEVLPRASQADVESLRREVEVTQEGETIDGKQVVRGNLPFVEHHGMWLYLDKVRAGLNKSFGEQAPE